MSHELFLHQERRLVRGQFSDAGLLTVVALGPGVGHGGGESRGERVVFHSTI